MFSASLWVGENNWLSGQAHDRDDGSQTHPTSNHMNAAF